MASIPHLPRLSAVPCPAASPQEPNGSMIVDADGDLWVAVRDAKRPGIYAYTPRGEEKAYIPTNVHFGRGEDANLLYITADSSLYRIRTNKRGHHLQQR